MVPQSASRIHDPGRDVTSSQGFQNSDTTIYGILHQYGSASTGSGDFANQHGLWADTNQALFDDGLGLNSAGPRRANSTADGLVKYDLNTVKEISMQRGIYVLPTIVENSLSYDAPVTPENQWDGSLVHPVPVPTDGSTIVTTGSSSALWSQDLAVTAPVADTSSVVPAANVASTAIGRRFTCLHPGCVRSFARSSDLKRHVGKHNSGARTHHCFENGCNYNGAKGFYRRDKLVDHQKTRHGMHMPVPVSNVNTFGY